MYAAIIAYAQHLYSTLLI